MVRWQYLLTIDTDKHHSRRGRAPPQDDRYLPENAEYLPRPAKQSLPTDPHRIQAQQRCPWQVSLPLKAQAKIHTSNPLTPQNPQTSNSKTAAHQPRKPPPAAAMSHHPNTPPPPSPCKPRTAPASNATDRQPHAAREKRREPYPIAIMPQHDTPLQTRTRIPRRHKRRHRIERVPNNQRRVAGPDAKIAGVALLGGHAPLRARGHVVHDPIPGEPADGPQLLHDGQDVGEGVGPRELVAALDAEAVLGEVHVLGELEGGVDGGEEGGVVGEEGVEEGGEGGPEGGGGEGEEDGVADEGVVEQDAVVGLGVVFGGVDEGVDGGFEGGGGGVGGGEGAGGGAGGEAVG